MSYIWSAADSIAQVLNSGNVVIVESTIPVGTTQAIAHYLTQKTSLEAGKDFFIAHCPERVLPGNIFYELIHNARIIGGINEQSTQYALKFYKKFVQDELHTTSAKAAEMIKLVENSSRDVAIAFANEVANMAYSAKLNPFEIIELANKHPRVSILQPSCGVGGHCIAVDPWFLVESFPKATTLIQAARSVNDTKPHFVLQTIATCIETYQKNNFSKIPNVLVLGLTYKQDVDDLRESPALAIAQKLASRTDIELLICEPYTHNQNVQGLQPSMLVSLEQGIAKADIVVCLVKHSIFQNIDVELLSKKIVLDFCGLFYKHALLFGSETVKFYNSTEFKELAK